MRAEGPLEEAEDRAIFARSIARRAGVDEETVGIDNVVNNLEAHYFFERERMRFGANARDYNVVKRANDLYDAELLIYLADASLHLLTSDRGFRRASSHLRPAESTWSHPSHYRMLRLRRLLYGA